MDSRDPNIFILLCILLLLNMLNNLYIQKKNIVDPSFDPITSKYEVGTYF